MKCPICDAEMEKRTNKTTGDQFWGCVRFKTDECKGTRPISEYEKMLEAGAPTLFDIKELS